MTGWYGYEHVRQSLADLQGERLLFTGDEARIMARAAENWRDMMVMLDQRARELEAERWIKGGLAPTRAEDIP